jgi:hypothetical protein
LFDVALELINIVRYILEGAIAEEMDAYFYINAIKVDK